MDCEYADSVARSPEVYDRIRDDTTPPRETVTLSGVPALYLRAFDGDDPVGVFMLALKPKGELEAHTLLTVTGYRALALGRLALDFIFTESPCLRVTSVCRSNNRPAHIFASLMGLKDVRPLPPVTVNGKLVEQMEVAITREEWAQKYHPQP